MKDLKPCPFCGTHPKAEFKKCACDNKDCIIYGEDWNTRITQPNLTEEIINGLRFDIIDDTNQFIEHEDGDFIDAQVLLQTLYQLQTEHEVKEWIETEHEQPKEEDLEVEGYSEEWINLDVNPKGIRSCCYYEDIDGFTWASAYWSSCYDGYCNDDETVPTHWRRKPNPPKN